MNNCATYKNVRREVFNAAADRIETDDKLRAVTMYYHGNRFEGEVYIEAHINDREAYAKVLQIFNEEYCK